MFDLPHLSAHDISRHDVVKDITRVEAILADGYADFGCVLVLSNDRSYWQPPARAGSIDAAFRLHEGRVLAGTLSWAARAGAGTTKGRDAPLQLADRYTCRWRDFSRVGLPNSRAAVFRYLLMIATADPDTPHSAPDANPAPEVGLAEAPAEVPSPGRASPPAGGARRRSCRPRAGSRAARPTDRSP
jgi:hypothetical protein